LQRVDDQQDVMVNDRFISSSREPGARPGRKALDVGLGEPAETIAKKAMEKKAMFFGEHGLAAG
jgi:hypothetical protein